VTFASATIGDVAVDLRSGFASGEDDPGGVVQFRMNNVGRTGEINWDKLRRVPSSRTRSDLLVEPGDILFNATNSPELVGKTALFLGFSEPVTFSNHFIRIRSDKKVVEPAYVARWLQREFERRRFERMCRSWVNQASITKDQLTSLSLPLPPLNEQRRIAAVLDRADELRRKRKRSLDLLDSLVQSIFGDMFGDRSDPTLELKDVVKKGTIVTYGIVQAGPEHPNGVPYIRTGDLVGGQIQLGSLKRTDPAIAARFSRSRVGAGDIVMSIRATVGTTAVVPRELEGANLTQGTARIAPGENARQTYPLEYLRSERVQRWIAAQVKGATFLEITLGRLRELPVALPPLNLQEKFSTIIDKLRFDRLLSAKQANAADILFLALQHRAFSGQL
jgi:type I restriction enzyme S subunit